MKVPAAFFLTTFPLSRRHRIPFEFRMLALAMAELRISSRRSSKECARRRV